MDSFISRQELASYFYSEIINDLVDVPHSAALLSEGSEVLGYDQPLSMDHSWGPRILIFVDSSEVERVLSNIEDKLPSKFMEYPVRFYSWKTKTVQHHIEVTTLENWLSSHWNPSSIGTYRYKMAVDPSTTFTSGYRRCSLQG